MGVPLSHCPQDCLLLLYSFADGFTKRKIEDALNWLIAGVGRLSPAPFDLFQVREQFIHRSPSNEFRIILPIHSHLRYVGYKYDYSILKWKPRKPWKCIGINGGMEYYDGVDLWYREKWSEDDNRWITKRTLYYHQILSPLREGDFQECFTSSLPYYGTFLFEFRGKYVDYQSTCDFAAVNGSP